VEDKKITFISALLFLFQRKLHIVILFFSFLYKYIQKHQQSLGKNKATVLYSL